jgi:CRISPR/Cas system CSM-associated protein Csm3 (group 7 of RAMP superfamily)
MTTDTNKPLTGYKTSDKVVGKIILKATLKNTSPLLIGSGKADVADKEIVRLPNGRPYIPASAIAGKLRRLFVTRQTTIKETDKIFQQFWGVDTDQKSYQSHIIFDNLTLTDENFYTTIRDGVKIEHKTNLAKDQAKYDYELLEPGHSFDFSAEITIRQSFTPFLIEEKGLGIEVTFKQIAQLILDLLSDKSFRIGAHETSGFGEMECTEANLYAFDFPTDADAWFTYVENDKKPTPTAIENKIVLTQPQSFSIKATFQIKTTFLTATHGVASSEPDKTQLKRKNKGAVEFILSGKALRGAIRHRGLRILRTIGIGETEAKAKINDLFGMVDEQNKQAKKSRLRIKESEFTQTETMNQTRIKIDRFTGGTISGALQEAQPLAKGQIELEIEIPNYTDQDAALLMFILKDLWTADLPIGGDKNIGRGVLQGVSGTVTMNNQTLCLEKLGQTDYQIPESFETLSLEAWKP